MTLESKKWKLPNKVQSWRAVWNLTVHWKDWQSEFLSAKTCSFYFSLCRFYYLMVILYYQSKKWKKMYLLLSIYLVIYYVNKFFRYWSWFWICWNTQHQKASREKIWYNLKIKHTKRCYSNLHSRSYEQLYLYSGIAQDHVFFDCNC